MNTNRFFWLEVCVRQLQRQGALPAENGPCTRVTRVVEECLWVEVLRLFCQKEHVAMWVSVGWCWSQPRQRGRTILQA